ncbi:hypothetical protein FDP41_009711 [Naegleria fowleri]|uniref:Uncharacterized protein n=1 Tax=Naegleria fowleri TaxID=5763 RepID=A0A6A5BD11_NAEFO|nr:uncharacterized protein FDP41_009711 [Naegleria fowleri]KAF0972015.1 hypothetical protein FDP41_009711 [Naegleria fowleri]
MMINHPQLTPNVQVDSYFYLFSNKPIFELICGYLDRQSRWLAYATCKTTYAFSLSIEQEFLRQLLLECCKGLPIPKHLPEKRPQFTCKLTSSSNMNPQVVLNTPSNTPTHPVWESLLSLGK